MGRYVRAVLADLSSQPDITLTLLVRDPRNAAAYHAVVPAARVAALPAARRAGFDVMWYPWNGVRFDAQAPAVVTINDDFAFAFPAAGRIARWREQRPILRALERARRIITISDWSRRTLVDRFALDAARLSVIPLAPDPYFSPGSEPSPYAEPFVLVVGGRDERKNIDFLIDVFARAFPQQDVRLVVVGVDAPARQSPLDARPISYTSLVDDALLRRLYRTAAAVAVPSLAEGFGLVAAEAQACGAPVIAANTSALPDVVGIAGICVDPRDATAWTTALRDLVRNSGLNAYYRSQSLARWQPDGSRTMTAPAVRAVLQSVINDRP